MIVAHARNVRLIGESRKKDDRLDVRTLARLARIDPQLLLKHRLNRERPTCTERNESLLESADGSMATVATRREKKPAYQKETRIDLTPTGLLMEGHYTQISTAFGSGLIRSIRQ